MVGVECLVVELTLTEFTDIVGINAHFLISCATALNYAVGITLVSVILAVRDLSQIGVVITLLRYSLSRFTLVLPGTNTGYDSK